MFPTNVVVTGAREVQAACEAYAPKARDAFAGAMYLWGSRVATTAMRLTPVLTGWLRRSRYVTRPDISFMSFTFAVGFSAWYAWHVHERWSKHATGEWKFLATAIAFHNAEASAMIAQTTAKLLKAGRGINSIRPLHPEEPMQGPVRRLRLSADQQRRRRAGIRRNDRRIGRESAAALAAQRADSVVPRPGGGRR